jgi:hypothetical protein
MNVFDMNDEQHIIQKTIARNKYPPEKLLLPEFYLINLSD